MESTKGPHLVLTTGYLLPAGGAEQVVANIALAAQAQGYEVTVIVRETVAADNQYVRRLQSRQVRVVAPSPATVAFLTGVLMVVKRLAQGLFPVYWATKRTKLRVTWSRFEEELRYHLVQRPMHRVLDRWLLLSLAREHARRPTDFIHGHRIDWAMPVVARWARAKRIPMVWHEHTDMPRPDNFQRLLWAYTGQPLARLSEGCDIAVLSPILVSRVPLVYGPGRQITPIGNWVEDPGVAAHPGQGEGAFTVGAVSRVVEGKGLETLVEALGRAAQQGAEVRGVIMGDGRFMARLKQMAAKEPTASRLEFTGALQAEEVRQRLALLDVFVLVSEAEGMPMSIIEAMAIGLPIVATPVGAVPDLVQEGVNGFLVAVGDVEALTERLCELASQPDLVQRMGQASRELYLANHTEEAVWPKLAALYDRLITEGRSTS